MASIHFRKLAIFSGYPQQHYEFRTLDPHGTWDTFSEAPVIWIRALSFASLAPPALTSGWSDMIRMTKPYEITLNIIKPRTQNVGIIQNLCKVLVWYLSALYCWVLSWAECSKNEPFLEAESCFIHFRCPEIQHPTIYSWRPCSWD